MFRQHLWPQIPFYVYIILWIASDQQFRSMISIFMQVKILLLSIKSILMLLDNFFQNACFYFFMLFICIFLHDHNQYIFERLNLSFSFRAGIIKVIIPNLQYSSLQPTTSTLTHLLPCQILSSVVIPFNSLLQSIFKDSMKEEGKIFTYKKDGNLENYSSIRIKIQQSTKSFMLNNLQQQFLPTNSSHGANQYLNSQLSSRFRGDQVSSLDLLQNKIRYYNDTAVYKIRQDQTEQAFVFLKQAQKLMQSAINNNNKFDIVYMLCVLQNEACAYSKVSNKQNCLAYLSALIENLESDIDEKNKLYSKPFHLNVSGTQKNYLKTLINKFLLLIEYYLYLVGIYTQLENHENAIEKLRNCLDMMKEVSEKIMQLEIVSSNLSFGDKPCQGILDYVLGLKSLASQQIMQVEQHCTEYDITLLLREVKNSSFTQSELFGNSNELIKLLNHTSSYTEIQSSTIEQIYSRFYSSYSTTISQPSIGATSQFPFLSAKMQIGIYCSICYFEIATSNRLILAKKYYENRKQTDQYRYSRQLHLKSIEIYLKNIKFWSRYIQHIVQSYEKVYSVDFRKITFHGNQLAKQHYEVSNIPVYSQNLQKQRQQRGRMSSYEREYEYRQKLGQYYLQANKRNVIDTVQQLHQIHSNVQNDVEQQLQQFNKRKIYFDFQPKAKEKVGQQYIQKIKASINKGQQKIKNRKQFQQPENVLSTRNKQRGGRKQKEAIGSRGQQRDNELSKQQRFGVYNGMCEDADHELSIEEKIRKQQYKPKSYQNIYQQNKKKQKDKEKEKEKEKERQKQKSNDNPSIQAQKNRTYQKSDLNEGQKDRELKQNILQSKKNKNKIQVIRSKQKLFHFHSNHNLKTKKNTHMLDLKRNQYYQTHRIVDRSKRNELSSNEKLSKNSKNEKKSKQKILKKNPHYTSNDQINSSKNRNSPRKEINLPAQIKRIRKNFQLEQPNTVSVYGIEPGKNYQQKMKNKKMFKELRTDKEKKDNKTKLTITKNRSSKRNMEVGSKKGKNFSQSTERLSSNSYKLKHLASLRNSKQKGKLMFNHQRVNNLDGKKNQSQTEYDPDNLMLKSKRKKEKSKSDHNNHYQRKTESQDEYLINNTNSNRFKINELQKKYRFWETEKEIPEHSSTFRQEHFSRENQLSPISNQVGYLVSTSNKQFEVPSEKVSAQEKGAKFRKEGQKIRKKKKSQQSLQQYSTQKHNMKSKRKSLNSFIMKNQKDQKVYLQKSRKKL